MLSMLIGSNWLYLQFRDYLKLCLSLFSHFVSVQRRPQCNSTQVGMEEDFLPLQHHRSRTPALYHCNDLPKSFSGSIHSHETQTTAVLTEILFCAHSACSCTSHSPECSAGWCLINHCHCHLTLQSHKGTNCISAAKWKHIVSHV